MNHGKYVFSQLMEMLPYYEFNKCVSRYRGNLKARNFKCWQQFLSMSFGQLTHRESLRDIVTCLNAQHDKIYHLGFKSNLAKSTLSDANKIRDWRIYADFAQILIKEAKYLYDEDPEFCLDLDHTVYALDATLIRLCVNVFNLAHYRETKAAIKIHTLFNVQNSIPEFVHITEGLVHEMSILKHIPFQAGAFYVMDRGYMNLKQLSNIDQANAFFVIRAKDTLNFKRQYSREKSEKENILLDQIGEFKNYYSKKHYPQKIRVIKSKDADSGKSIVLLTNNLEIEASWISELYRQRWKVELFFKWIKQNLKIKVFWGETENAVKIQIWTALSTYLIVAIMRKRLKIKQNMYEILQILSVSVFDKTPLLQLFTKNNINISKNENYNQLNIF